MKAWLVNTNSNPINGNPNGYKFMLRQNKVASYFGKKNAVDVISPKDLVLLYHNENRVIAVGFVLDSPEHDYGGLKKIEHWKDVNWIWKAKFNNDFDPINSIDRNKLGITFVNNTVVNISGQLDYKTLFEEIGERQNYFNH